MKLYKVINKENKAKDGGDFDYKDYLPKGKLKGKWTPTIENLDKCNNGYHVTPYWNMWLNNETNRVFEVEVKGLVEDDSVGVIDKYVCKSFRFVKEIKIRLDKNRNTGHKNTGDKNTGSWNTGSWNTGDKNTGDMNTGDKNTGHKNTGSWNTGNWNTGDKNTGYWNTGYWNTGNWNTGHKNTGSWNTGNWNTGHNNTGCFNTKEPEYYELFNKPIKKEEYQKIIFPNWLHFELTEEGYKESFLKAFKKASKEEIQQTIKLPNFDYDVFKEISGITKKMIKKKLGLK